MNFPSVATLGFLDVFILVLLVVAIPLLGMWQHQRLVRWLAQGQENARLRHYRFILISEWVLTVPLLIWWFAAGRTAEPLSLIPTTSGWQWILVGLALLAATYLIAQAKVVVTRPEELAKVREKIGNLADMAPRSDPESRTFNALSVTAGVCEEILYRGLLLAVIASASGLWVAAIASSLFFGLGHSYQGAGGIVKTTLVGGVMAAITLLSGSIYPAMILHAVVDVTSGRMMRAALREGTDAPTRDDAADAPAG